MNTNRLFDIIVPCYNEEKCINFPYEHVDDALCAVKKVKWNIVFIDDGSTDSTMEKIKRLAIEKMNIKYIPFSRIFGKESAIYAGLSYS